jgi:hypothetical protein
MKPKGIMACDTVNTTTTLVDVAESLGNNSINIGDFN